MTNNAVVDCVCYYEIDETKERIVSSGDNEADVYFKLMDTLITKFKGKILPSGKVYGLTYVKLKG